MIQKINKMILKKQKSFHKRIMILNDYIYTHKFNINS